MKTQITILLFFFLSQNLFAQQPLIAISDQMNVIYIGIDNPVTVAVEGYTSDHFSVSSDDVEVIKLGAGKYNLIPRTPGEVKLKVQPKGKDTQEITYRVKQIPDPRARIGWSSGGQIEISTLKFQDGVSAHLIGFDIGKAEVLEYEMTVQYKDGKDPVSVFNKGGKFTATTKELLETFKAGDTVYFDNIKSKCPGDKAARKMNAMIFKLI